MTEWTDEELAKQLKRIAPVVIPRGPLLEAAADRLLALSAHVALLKASLAQAEKEAEKPAASAEPFGYFRALPMCWEDCAETDEGAIPLYERPQPDRVAELEAEVERLRGWLAMLIDLYEDGSPCYSAPYNEGDFLGYAIHIDNEPFKAICDWLNTNDQAGKEAPHA